MDKTIYEIISSEDITILYQPIVNLITGEIMGYEALSRGPEWSRLFSPLALIKEAELFGLSYELELLMRKKAIENASAISPSLKLFVNINPGFIKDDDIEKGRTMQFLNNNHMSPENIVFELTERTMISDYESFNRILNHYRSQNYRIAIDDVGEGYSGLRTIRETKPHFIKIDMELIRNIDSDPIKEALINAMLTFSIRTNIKLIAEGIETENELKKLIKMGVHYGQGYFLQKPSKIISSIREDVINLIEALNHVHRDLHLFSNSQSMIGSIAVQSSIIDKYTTCENAKIIFEKTGEEGLCIVEAGKPIGIIMRENLLFMLSSPYGLSLYSKKPISHVMDNEFSLTDYFSSITEVSSNAMSRPQKHIYDIIVVTREGNFFGTVSVNRLLVKLVEVETQIAKELNPLTHLPGNLIINRVLNDIILYKPICSIVYIDFDFFKPFNDYYGFEKGDKLLKAASEMIAKTTKGSFGFGSFVGHIGGDDFILVMEASKETVIDICQSIIQQFNEMILDFYLQEDIRRGYIEVHDRNGFLTRFPKLTLSFACAYGSMNHFKNVSDLSMFMSQLKKKAKDQLGHSIVISDFNQNGSEIIEEIY